MYEFEEFENNLLPETAGCDGMLYIDEAYGNKVSRQSTLFSSTNIFVAGKTIIQSNCVLRGDLANVRIGRHCILSKRSIFQPPFKKFSTGGAFLPLHIGDYVFVGEDTIINAAQIGSYVYIGQNVVVGRCCILKDGCMIEDNTVLGADTVVPPFAIFSGNPGVYSGEMPESNQAIMMNFTKSYYQNFLPTIVK